MQSIVSFMIRKGIRLASLIAAICVITFILISQSPIDPIQAYIGADMMRVGPEQREKIAENWGLNEPPAEQFFRWSTSVLQGDLGTSMIYRRPVTEIISEKFLYSLTLMVIAWVLSGIIGFVLGIIAAMKKRDMGRPNHQRVLLYISLDTNLLDGAVISYGFCCLVRLASNWNGSSCRCSG